MWKVLTMEHMQVTYTANTIFYQGQDVIYMIE